MILCIVLLLTAQIGSSLGLLVGNIINFNFIQINFFKKKNKGILGQQVSVAIAATPFIILPFFIFSGFLVNHKNVPSWLKWLEYLSFVRYGFEALTLNEVYNSLFF